MENKIKFEFTVEEANVILGSLGAQPYQQVASLIENIKQQAATQLQSQPAAAAETDE